jgi:hypothetical protein
MIKQSRNPDLQQKRENEKLLPKIVDDEIQNKT